MERELGRVVLAELEPQLLVRAVARRSKISTIVTSETHASFQVNYGNIMKVHMDALKLAPAKGKGKAKSKSKTSADTRRRKARKAKKRA